MSREDLRTLQSRKLVAAFEYLMAHSPYYRARYAAAGLTPGSVRSLDDLRRIPVTRKHDWIPDIEANPPWGTFSPLTAQRWRANPWQVFSTSGTTRRPRMFRHTTHDREMWAWMGARALWSYGVRRGQLALNCFYYGASVAAWGLHEALLLVGCPVIPAGAMPPERRVEFVRHLRPQVLLGTPSSLLSLGRRLRDKGEDPRALGVQTLVCAGEPGAAVRATKQRLEAMFAATAHDDFGCTEVAMAPLGYTCQAEASKTSGPVGVHLMEDALIVEVLEPDTLEPVAPGERGTLVVSNLFSESAPFLRFDMGDWIQVTHEPCACGRTHARALGGLLGRSDHCLNIKGLQFFPSTFEDAIRAIPGLGDEYRVTVTRDAAHQERDEVRVEVEREPSSAITVEDVVRELKGSLGVRIEVTVLPPGGLPRTEGKGDRLVDRRGEP